MAIYFPWCLLCSKTALVLHLFFQLGFTLLLWQGATLSSLTEQDPQGELEYMHGGKPLELVFQSSLPKEWGILYLQLYAFVFLPAEKENAKYIPKIWQWLQLEFTQVFREAGSRSVTPLQAEAKFCLIFSCAAVIWKNNTSQTLQCRLWFSVCVYRD